MTSLSASLRARMHRLTPVLGLLLLTVLFVGGTHHHADGPHHACVLCTAGNSTAVAAPLPSPAAAPLGAIERISSVAHRAPRVTRLETAPSRAPPLA